MSVKDFLRKANAVISTTSLFILTLVCWLAFLSGDWMITLNFNAVGEGLAELVLLSVGSVNGLYWFWKERNGKITHDYEREVEERVSKVL